MFFFKNYMKRQKNIREPYFYIKWLSNDFWKVFSFPIFFMKQFVFKYLRKEGYILGTWRGYQNWNLYTSENNISEKSPYNTTWKLLVSLASRNLYRNKFAIGENLQALKISETKKCEKMQNKFFWYAVIKTKQKNIFGFLIVFSLSAIVMLIKITKNVIVST